MTEAEWIAFLRRPEIPAFNRAMLENPADDLPRLVFADWMDENCPDVEVNAAVRESITGQHKGASWPGLRGNRKWNISFARGRVTAWINIQVRPPSRRPARTLLEAVWQAEWVESASFGPVRGYTLHGWVYDPPMRLVRGVRLSGGAWCAVSLANWLSSAVMGRMTALAIYGPCPDEGWLQALANSPQISRLESLSLEACRIGDDGAVAIANSPHLVRLTHLTIDDNGITSVGAAALANSPYLCEAIRAVWRR